jgi:methylmalonyl-CoA mutase cobalamin-binding subunit
MGDGGGRASRGCDDLGYDHDLGQNHAEVPAPGGLMEALLDPDPDRSARTLLRIARRDVDRFVDRILPEAAVLLGRLWLEDRAGFAEVTMATSRLQSVLREVDPGMEAPDAPLVAVVVPRGETHTLGAAVAAWRLRRAGASVMLLVGRPEEEVLAALGGGDLAAVCLSASGGEGATLAPLVKRLRAASGAPVVLGGSILVGRDPEAVRLACGADAVGRTPEDALTIARKGCP